jgi:CRP-like cAMP-binding protein
VGTVISNQELFGTNTKLIIDGAFATVAARQTRSEARYDEQFGLSLPGSIFYYPGVVAPEFLREFESNSVVCLTDVWLAGFSSNLIQELFYSDRAFARAYLLQLAAASTLSSQIAAICRSRFVDWSVGYLVRILLRPRIYLNQTRMAELLNFNRASVSRAMALLARQEPQLYAAYAANKGRRIGPVGRV